MQAKKRRGRIEAPAHTIDDRHPAERLAQPFDAPIAYELDERAVYVEHTPSAELSRKWGSR
jgi:hypothetical protein